MFLLAKWDGWQLVKPSWLGSVLIQKMEIRPNVNRDRINWYIVAHMWPHSAQPWTLTCKRSICAELCVSQLTSAPWKRCRLPADTAILFSLKKWSIDWVVLSCKLMCSICMAWHKAPRFTSSYNTVWQLYAVINGFKWFLKHGFFRTVFNIIN